MEVINATRKHWLQVYVEDAAGYVWYIVTNAPIYHWHYALTFHRVAMRMKRARVLLEK